jgi:hypothetical protein
MLSHDERAAEWHRRFDEQMSSGLSVVGWCRKHGIEKNRFYGWRKRLAQAPVSAVSSPQFIAVKVEPSAPAADLPAAAVTGVTVRIGRVAVEVSPGFDAVVLADVLSILESRVSPC